MSIATPVHKRILLKLSGEALMGEDAFGINRATIGRIVEEIAEVTHLGVEVAVVIGGGVMGGGGGGAWGTLGGVFTLGLINNLLNLQNVQSYWQQIVKGAIILFAVLARRKQR